MIGSWLCVDGLNGELREACSMYDRGSGCAPHSEDKDWNLRVKEHRPQSHPSITRLEESRLLRLVYRVTCLLKKKNSV